MRSALRSMLSFACVVLLPTWALAQGATLHGFGPINSSMGGAGVALPEDSLNALGFNPALVAAAEGNQLSFTNEFSKDNIRIHTTLGSFSGNAYRRTSSRSRRRLAGWCVIRTRSWRSASA